MSIPSGLNTESKWILSDRAWNLTCSRHLLLEVNCTIECNYRPHLCLSASLAHCLIDGLTPAQGQPSKNILSMNYSSTQQMLLTQEPTKARNSMIVFAQTWKSKKIEQRTRLQIYSGRRKTGIWSWLQIPLHALMCSLALFQETDTFGFLPFF